MLDNLESTHAGSDIGADRNRRMAVPTSALTATPGLLPDRLMMRGSDPDLLGKELLHIIAEAIANQPRTLQRRIGPSEIGHPCARRLGYRLLGAPILNPHRIIAWKPYIGTAVHAQLERAFTQYNAAHVHEFDHRWLVETKVDVGQVGADEIDGSTDLYDRVTATVVDWKLVGPAPLRRYRAHGPGQQYRAQGHLYARGWARRGFPVDVVMIVFLPRNDELHQTYVWHEPYDERIAMEALSRVNAIHAATAALGVSVLEKLPTADAYCHRCPYFNPASTEIRLGCPGDPASRSTPTSALSFTGGINAPNTSKVS